jgi:hypothetical protein
VAYNHKKKPIRLTAHAKSYRFKRGFKESEIIETIQSSRWAPAPQGRMETSKEFAFDDCWNGRFYEKKLVHPIFVEEEGEIVVITVYVYYY